ncbi:recombinase family protein [Segatella copri]|jgi:DNA invertase Pin-like site-specific DNA recombinase|uniref:recombinase family protein n=1 Tax=Segatella copri TaxID=165179 RepID=UPI001933A56E|nr:recombinase family protein [Segatella copri]MBM0157339.1 recombinase family protein [Segatella copri]
MADTKSSRVIGYACEDEEIALQVDALRNEGVSIIYMEKNDDLDLRPELDRCLASLTDGDTLIVYGIDRIAKSVRDFITVAVMASGLGASIRSLTQPVDTSGPAGALLVKVLKEVVALEERTLNGPLTERAVS